MGITSSTEQQQQQSQQQSQQKQNASNVNDQQQQRYIQQQLQIHQQKQQQQTGGRSIPIQSSTSTIKGGGGGGGGGAVSLNIKQPINSNTYKQPGGTPTSLSGKSSPYGTNTPKLIPQMTSGGQGGAKGRGGPESFNVLMSPPSSPLVGMNMPLSPETPAAVPTVFTWTGGGKEVYISGSFNNWKEKLPLSHSEKDFTLIYNLPPGVHQYKYIVDGKWLHSTEQPVAADIKGNLLNFVEVKSKDTANDLNTFKLSSTPPGSYSKSIPEEEFQKIPPPSLPPHLRRALLNTQPSTEDPTLLPLPHHVMLNHLYSLPRKDKVTILGVTHRYKTKFVTTVLYKPENESTLDQI
ncbi:putative glycoside hydrolase [Tieghemostelium lacteum]|uniref:Putative glycoside hydrolase n=1 Tax=Tieghemostelium lacteum TaxID=361077 RepID=A0A151ZHY7_TIELA|nr:putative glycoside hydrolase [Tieghemostelium lacteum]|eukprot:KYQ93611.1 putative glycoside hydrolase [Tieghemostelium lacteum]